MIVNGVMLNAATTLADWYWTASDGRVYSSKRGQLVYPYDSGYRAFIAKHGAASPWPIDAQGKQTNQALHDVLTHHGIAANLPT
jgi:hypothetical protein